MSSKINLTDEELVNNFMAGDDPAFEDLLKRYLNPIYNFLFRFTGDAAVSNDLAQDTFIKTWKNLRRFDQNRNFRAWLYTIAKNIACDYFKKKKEIPFSRFTDDEGNNFLEDIADDEILPDEILERKNISEELDAILQKLPFHYRVILLLRYREDFSLHEIAEILEEPYNTIKSRHNRGLAKLKKLLISDSP